MILVMSPFRQDARSCPACTTPMEVIPIGDDQGVDLCRRCGGAFMDFFDGEPTALAHKLVRGRMGAHRGGDPTRKSQCPVCQLDLHMVNYMEKGPEVEHCDNCMGLFVGGEQLQAMSEYVETEEPPEHHLLQRMSHALKALVDSLSMP